MRKETNEAGEVVYISRSIYSGELGFIGDFAEYASGSPYSVIEVLWVLKSLLSAKDQAWAHTLRGLDLNYWQTARKMAIKASKESGQNAVLDALRPLVDERLRTAEEVGYPAPLRITLEEVKEKTIELGSSPDITCGGFFLDPGREGMTYRVKVVANWGAGSNLDRVYRFMVVPVHLGEDAEPSRKISWTEAQRLIKVAVKEAQEKEEEDDEDDYVYNIPRYGDYGEC